jgi:hypothetical protein
VTLAVEVLEGVVDELADCVLVAVCEDELVWVGVDV